MNQTNLADIEALLENLTIQELLDLMDFELDESIEPEKLFRNILISSLYGLIVLVSFFGNLLVLTVCLQNLTKTNTLILSLSSSDILMTVFNIPFNVVRLLREDWPFGQFLCFLVPFVQVTVVYVSSFTMAVIAFYRYKILNSYLPNSSLPYRSIIIIIIITWCLAALMAIPTSLFNQIVTVYTYKSFVRCRVVYPEYKINIPLIISLEVFLSQYLIPLSISIILYFKIGKVISRQGRIISLRGNCEAQRRQKHKRRRIIMLVLVVAVFAICWLPINIYHLLMDSHLVNYNYKIFITCHWLAMSSVCYNPFIYCWLNTTFRNGAKRICYLFCCSKIKASNHNASTRVCNLETTQVDANRNTIPLQEMRDNSLENSGIDIL